MESIESNTELMEKIEEQWIDITRRDKRIKELKATITELTEKLHYTEVSHIQADKRITKLRAGLNSMHEDAGWESI